MPVQDLTPQLRTRLSRVERVVGLFVTIASLLLIAGFGYYVYHTGQRKGWWTFKAKYHTFLDSASGLNIGTEVKLLGFTVGRITKITAMDPSFLFGDYGAVYIEFVVLDPYQGYIWNDSKVKTGGTLLGSRYLEVVPGGNSLKTDSNAVIHATYSKTNGIHQIYDEKEDKFVPFEDTSKGYWLPANDSPDITVRLEMVANQVQAALPGILALTNRLNQVLSNASAMTLQVNTVLAQARPALSNVTTITANLKDPKGSLGEWILPTNLHTQLLGTLANANVTLTNVNQTISHTDTNVTSLATNLDQTLIHLANITSNLNQQVQSNSNLVKSISDMIIHSDEFVQGLKHHWLLRSAFKNKDEDKKDQDRDAKKESKVTPPPKAGKWR
jgi:ABC-type transporter Mla subunit MlaD